MRTEYTSYTRRTGPVWLVITFVIALSGAVLISHLSSCSKNQEPIKIGAIIPLSGPASHHVLFADAMHLAVDEINASGGINGRKLELIVVDSKTDPEEGKKAFHRLEASHHPLCYISTTSAVSSALAPLAEENKVVLACPAVGNPAFTKQKKWVFKYYVSPEQEAKPILNILRKLKVHELAILYQNDSFGSPYHDEIKREFEKAGGRVVGVPFKTRNADFGALSAKLKNCEAVYMVGFFNTVARAIRQLRADRYQGHILAYSGASGLPLIMPKLSDIYVAASIIYNPSYVLAREAKKRYEARYNTAFSHQAANGYDLIRIIAGLLDGQDISRDNVRRLLDDAFSYPGILGFIEKKSGEHDIVFPLYPARIVNGYIEYLQ